MQNPPEYVCGVLYEITCTHPDAAEKKYIGQTRSHILNRGVYRVFGAHKRWTQHVTEAKKNAPKRQSWKLNNAIRKYGPEQFKVVELETCKLADADNRERALIALHSTILHGYNIQYGGARGAKNSEESRAKATATLKTWNDQKRSARYKDIAVVQVRLVRLESKGVRVYVDEQTGKCTYTSFFGRHSTLTESAERAVAFAMALVRNDASKIHVPASLKGIVRIEARQDC
jgi:group I intron endonuclease